LVNGNPENPVKQDVPGILAGWGIKKSGRRYQKEDGILKEWMNFPENRMDCSQMWEEISLNG
jgi:hypothetical protein